MARTSFLYRVGKTYYFRSRIPCDVSAYFPQEDIRRSLRTKSLTSARRLSKFFSAEAERLFTLIRSGMFKEHEIRELVDEYIAYTLKIDDRSRLDKQGQSSRLGDQDDGNLDGQYIAETYDYDVSDSIADELEATGASPTVERYVCNFLKYKEIVPDVGSYEFKVLCREVQRAHFEDIRRINIQRDLGMFEDKYHLPSQEVAPQQQQAQVQPIGAVQQLQPQSSVMTFKTLTELYLQEKEVTGSAEKVTRDANNRYFALYQELFSIAFGTQDIPLTVINRALVVKCQNQVVKVPKRRKSAKAFKGHGLRDLLKMDLPPEKCLSPAKVKDHISTLSSLFKWGTRHDYMLKNPAEGLIPKLDKRNAGHKPYSVEELQLLVERLYEVYQGAEAYKTFVPLIALFSGMRHGEVAQLWKKDIEDKDGVKCFRIHGEDGGKYRRLKKPKSVAGWRSVPIHPALVELGLLDYIDSIEDGHLWPEMYWSDTKKFSRHSDYYGKFNRKHITTDKKKVFHSFRSNFTNGLKQKQVSQDMIREIIGHELEDTMNMHYADAYEVVLKKEAVERLVYEDVDFSCLKWPF